MIAYRVTFSVYLPPEGEDATMKEIEDWLRFSLRDNGSLDLSNPLSDCEPEPIPGSFYVLRHERA
jgi:hypothetical protein